ncbi:SDR family oxidoreductase [Halogranum rubrum]|uniref:3-beta hydroxysteroid dehydrogenase/isomerase family protein n=1 Tax=Halogranum salarium B-1 TaxID=1210908 RepID=J3JEK4_9EURY|nr:SDR family oxidoreductase [Halogranum salarium]EJN58439.1 3-beta hydroxysteroid dehydrogenase/isomerase family protein [Halogranum salarium B-1]
MATTVLVAGASGGTGRRLLEQLETTDYTVRALTRSCRKVGTLSDLGADEVMVGDLLDPADAAKAVRGCDAVLCAVGTTPGLADFLGEDVVDGAGVVNLVNAAVAADVETFVMESALGVGDSRDQAPLGLRLVLWRYLTAKNHAEAWLRSSGLTYTIFRPGRLTDDPASGDILVGEGGATVRGAIARDDVARLMIAALSTPEAANRTFEVADHGDARGPTRGLVDVDWQFPPERPQSDDPIRIDVTEE